MKIGEEERNEILNEKREKKMQEEAEKYKHLSAKLKAKKER